MALPLQRFEENLPAGTYKDEGRHLYYWRGFKMSRVFLITASYKCNRFFNWKYHVDMTFRKCMKPMTDRFMRVT
jgi:hypothetical protein